MGGGGEIIKDVLCQDSLSGGNVGEPGRGGGAQQVWMEGAGESEMKKKEGDGGGREAERGR